MIKEPMNLFDSTTIPILQEVVTFAEARHTLLAGNIANLDTPGYKARDFSVDDFQQRLAKAITQGRQPNDSRSPGEAGYQPSAALAGVAKNSTAILRHDQCDVNLEQQVSEMVKNQLQHNTALAIMVNQFHQLETAISGRV
ncbi:MAG: flagellar basal body rod protein FlgB [Pirellulales bacterium]|nr:flagellar basal body rod protein FlgB [Pirellulales bacterium]